VSDKESSPEVEEAKHEDGGVDAGADVDDVNGKNVKGKAEESEGLGTTNPEENDATYAEKVKEEGVES